MSREDASMAQSIDRRIWRSHSPSDENGADDHVAGAFLEMCIVFATSSQDLRMVEPVASICFSKQGRKQFGSTCRAQTVGKCDCSGEVEEWGKDAGTTTTQNLRRHLPMPPSGQDLIGSLNRADWVV